MHTIEQRLPEASSVVLLAPELQAPGGVQSYMWHLVDALTSPRHTALKLKGIISYADRDALRIDPRLRHLSAGGLQVHVAHRSRLRFLVHAWRTASRGDIVVVGHPAQAPIAWLLKALGRIRAYVVCLHGIEAWCRMRPSVRGALRSADRIVVTTPYTALECSAINRIDLQCFHTIALSAGPEKAGSTEPNRTVACSSAFQFSSSQLNVLFVARQDRADLYKGFHAAFEAIALMRRAGLPAALHLVGGGDNHEALKQQAQHILGDNAQAVFFHGRLPDAQLQVAYAGCDVFLMPSLKEGFGIVFLEAMRHGKPCIGGWQGGTPWVIEDGRTGYLIAAHDAVQLANRLTRLHADPVLCEVLGQNGRERFERYFSFDQFREQWQSLLQTLVKKMPLNAGLSPCSQTPPISSLQAD